MSMNTEPKVGAYLDEEEKELIKAIEADDYDFGKSLLATECKAAFQKAAKNTNTINNQQKPFKVKTFNLGEDVEPSRDELYCGRGL